jgi:hypothetical protein
MGNTLGRYPAATRLIVASDPLRRPSAKGFASYDAPTNTQMAVGKNQMWVSGTRLGRYELQVSLQKVNREWVMNEGDTFC